MYILSLILTASAVILLFKMLGKQIKKWSDPPEDEPTEWAKMTGIDGKVRWIKKPKEKR